MPDCSGVASDIAFDVNDGCKSHARSTTACHATYSSTKQKKALVRSHEGDRVGRSIEDAEKWVAARQYRAQ